MPAPLSSIRVLDLTRLLPGPYATMALADLGAQVDKIEDLGAGDYLRHMPPQNADGTSPMFTAVNRNKRSACIDLKSERGVALFRRLVTRYDVLFEQFRPGVMERLGLSHASLLELNPRLVICALTGYGQSGPLAARAGHDLNYLARAGLLGMQGPHDGVPQTPGFQVADIGGALWSVIGIVSALFERETTGKGKVIDLSMTDAVRGFGAMSFSTLGTNDPPVRGGGLLTGGIAPYATYETSDGKFVALGALEPKFWSAFCNAVGIEPDMRALVPGEHQSAIRQTLSRIFRSRSRDAWAELGAEHDCCLEPVFDLQEALGGRPFASIPTPLADSGVPSRPAPRQGEHTERVLAEIGISPGEFRSLVHDGVVR